MVVDLKHIFVNENSSLPIEYSLDLSQVEHGGVFPLKKPVTLIGTVSNTSSLIRFQAEISFQFDALCDRCGKETSKTYQVEVSKSLATSIEGDDSDTILLVPDMKLDVDDFLYTEVIVNLPLKHLCSEDCKGICYKCGKNLNEGACSCDTREIDPRLAKLAELLNN